MKILIVTPSFYPATVYGGPIFSSLHISEELSKLEGVEVFVSTTNANMNIRLDVEIDKWIKFKNNFFVKYYNETKINFISLSLLFNLWKDIKRVDIVHIQYIFNTTILIALFYASFFKKPIVLSSRGALCDWCLKQGSIFKKMWLYLFIKPFIKKIHWHTTALQEKEEVLAQFPKAKVSIIPNWIEFNKFQFSNKLSKEEFSMKFVNEVLNIEKFNNKSPIILIMYILVLHKVIKPEWDLYFTFASLIQSYIMYFILLKIVGIKKIKILTHKKRYNL